MNKVKLNPDCLIRPQYRSYSQYLKELVKRLPTLSAEEKKQYDEEQKQYDEIWNRHAEDDF